MGCRSSCALTRVHACVRACVIVALWSAGPAVHSFERVRVCVCAYVAGVLWGAGPAVHSLACMRALL